MTHLTPLKKRCTSRLKLSKLRYILGNLLEEKALQEESCFYKMQIRMDGYFVFACYKTVTLFYTATSTRIEEQ